MSGKFRLPIVALLGWRDLLPPDEAGLAYDKLDDKVALSCDLVSASGSQEEEGLRVEITCGGGSGLRGRTLAVGGRSKMQSLFLSCKSCISPLCRVNVVINHKSVVRTWPAEHGPEAELTLLESRTVTSAP
jgi:hypothetical protein